MYQGGPPTMDGNGPPGGMPTQAGQGASGQQQTGAATSQQGGASKATADSKSGSKGPKRPSMKDRIEKTAPEDHAMEIQFRMEEQAYRASHKK